MKLKRLFSALLVLGILSGMLGAALAADSDTDGDASSEVPYQVRYDVTGETVELSLTNLPVEGQLVHSVQLELPFYGMTYVGFELDEVLKEKEDLAHIYALAVTEDNFDGEELHTKLTLYVDSLVPLNDGATLWLGTVTLKSVKDKELSFPDKAKLILLDERQHKIGGSDGPMEVDVIDANSDSPEIPSRPGTDTPVTPGTNGSTGSSSGATHVSRPSGSDTAASSSSSANQTHRVTASTVQNGSVRLSPTSAREGSTVTITVTPDAGYVLSDLAVYDSRSRALSLRDNGDGTFTFTMPDGDVRVEAEFAPAGAAASNPSDTALPFRDVASSDWFYDAVGYVYEHGMMSGTSTSTFAPDGKTDRAMIVSILYRLEGSPAAGSSGFPDVAAGQYYADAVAWAASNGIVSGYSNGEFRPNDSITREQLASILYRYAQFKGYSTAASAELNSFADASAVSSYAAAAVRWAVGEGLISGTNLGTLDPAGGAARGQVASILMRFCQNTAKLA